MSATLLARMNLTVVLVNWGNERQTLRCVRSISNWSMLSPRLVVVDNQSTDATSRRLSAALSPDQLIRSAINLGYGGGNNLGIRRALEGSETHLLLLNSDAEITEAAVSRLLDRLARHREISIIGPVLNERSEKETKCLAGGRDIALHPVTRIAVEPGELLVLPGYPLHAVDYVPGTVFLARRSVFEKVGLFDERYFFSGEIADFCRRAKTREYDAVVDLEVAADHDIGHVSSQLRDTLYAYYSLRNRYLFVRKHHASDKPQLFAYWTKIASRQIVRALMHGNTSRARAIFLAVAHGLSNQYGNQNAKFL